VTVEVLDHRTCDRCGAWAQLDGEQVTGLAGRILDAIDHDEGTLRHELTGTIPLSRRRHGSVVHLRLLPGAPAPPPGAPGDYRRSVMVHGALLAAFDAPG
jgi:hypothetical protein